MQKRAPDIFRHDAVVSDTQPRKYVIADQSVGEIQPMDVPQPGVGQLRMKVAASLISPGTALISEAWARLAGRRASPLSAQSTGAVGRHFCYSDEWLRISRLLLRGLPARR